MTTVKFEFKVIRFTGTWYADDGRNEIFNSENYTSINQVREYGRVGGICIVTLRCQITVEAGKFLKNLINARGQGGGEYFSENLINSGKGGEGVK